MKFDKLQTDFQGLKRGRNMQKTKSTESEGGEEMEREISAVSQTQKGISTVSRFPLHPPTPLLTPQSGYLW